jgi:uncharacterized protein
VSDDEIIVTGRRPTEKREPAPAPSIVGQGPVALPDWRVILDGEDLTAKLQPYLMNLSISERRGDLADELRITLNDSAGRLDIPKAGADLRVHLGWKRGRDVKIGLVDKGTFIVDEASHRNPPATITIRARSADFAGAWRKLRSQTWRGKTLGDVINDIAARQSLTAKIEPGLAARPIKLCEQKRESDVAFMARLGKDYDAVSTVKNGYLLFIPMAGGKSAGGQLLPVITIERGQSDGHDYTIEAREDYSGVVAKWRSIKTAKVKSVKIDKRKNKKTKLPKSKAKTGAGEASAGSDENPKVLKQMFASEAEAKRAAEAEWARIQRAPRKLRLQLALGRPDMGADDPVIAKGFHPEIDALDWVVDSVTHSLGRDGLTTDIDCEIPDNPPEGSARSEADEGGTS